MTSINLGRAVKNPYLARTAIATAQGLTTGVTQYLGYVYLAGGTIFVVLGLVRQNGWAVAIGIANVMLWVAWVVLTRNRRRSITLNHALLEQPRD